MMRNRILFIAPYNLGQRHGGALATLAYYNAIKQLYGDLVDLMMPAEFATGVFSNAIGVPARSTIKAMLSGSMHRYKRFLDDYLRKNGDQYKFCVFNNGFYAGDTMRMIHHYGLRIMVIHHNFEREYAMGDKSLFTLYGRTPYLVVRNEKKAYLEADVNCFLTPEDIDLFVSYYGESRGANQLIGVFEPIETVLLHPSGYIEQKIVITGSMNTRQTMCGIEDIHRYYYSIIKTLCPDWNLVIAGRNPGHEVYDLQNENPSKIIVVPNPKNMEDITKTASIFLCPTNVGGGLKLRVMDGLRMGLPILVHKVSARGYNFFYDKPYFKVYENKEQFSSGLECLLSYCQNNYNREQIQNDYLSFFSFSSGCNRIKKAISLID